MGPHCVVESQDARYTDKGGVAARQTQQTVPAVAQPAPSLLRMIGWCWRRPRLLVVELLWRWLCGGSLLLLVGLEAERIANAAGPAVQATGLLNATLPAAIQDPATLSASFASTVAILKPWITHAALGLAPLALFAWAAGFAIGRTALLRRYDPALPSRGWLLAGCEGVRLLALVAISAFWYSACGWASRYALGPASDPAAAQAEPNLVLYCVLVILISGALFVTWSLASWALIAAPLVALVNRSSVWRGLARSMRLGRVRGKLVEVNLAMAVIKLGLMVLAMVFSATPLPFASAAQGWQLSAWWVFVTLVYMAASDFFKMARLFVFLEYLR